MNKAKALDDLANYLSNDPYITDDDLVNICDYYWSERLDDEENENK